MKQAGKTVVDGVARLVGFHAPADGLPDEGKVAEEVENLMACRLVLPLQGAHLEESEVRGIAVGRSELIGEGVELCLRHLAVVDDEGIRQVAATDKSHLEEGCYLADKDERSRCGKVGGEAAEPRQVCLLRGDEFGAFEIDGGIDAQPRRRCHCRGCGRPELALAAVLIAFGIGGEGRQDAQPRPRPFVAIFQRLGDGEIFARSILLKESDAENLADIEAAAAIEDGEEWALLLGRL